MWISLLHILNQWEYYPLLIQWCSKYCNHTCIKMIEAKFAIKCSICSRMLFAMEMSKAQELLLNKNIDCSNI